MTKLMQNRVLFHRFIKVPSILALTVGILLWFNIEIFAIVHTSNSFLGILACTVVGAFGYLFSDVAAGVTKRVLMRQRIWSWGRNKFSTWEEMADWIDKTPANRLEYLAGTPDDSWEP